MMEEGYATEGDDGAGVGADERESAWVHGDAQFAGTREVAHHVTPDRVIMAREEAVSLGEALGPEEIREARLEHWRAFVGYVMQGGKANPWQGFKNFLAALRRACPEMLDGASATEIGILLGEGKAAVSAREIRVVEAQMRRWGVTGFHGFDTKSESARAASRRSAKGNKNRRKRKGI